MARENRRENRKAAKELLEGSATLSLEDIKAAQKAQLDFFDKTSDESILSTGEDDEEEQTLETEENSEVDEVVETSDPNVESKVEEVAKTSEEESDEQDLDLGTEEGEKTAVKEPETETKIEAPVVAETAAVKTTEPEKIEAKVEEKVTETKPEADVKLSPEEAGKLFTEWRGQTEDLLANHHYRLNEDQVNELNENPAAVIPKLMSKVYMDSISAAFQQFTNYLPRMVHQVIEQRNSMSKSEEAFFSKWPDLMDKKDTVIRLGQSYREANPTATQEQFINEVGAQAMVALRLMPINGGTPAAKPVEKQVPFKPAVGTPAPAPVTNKSTNPFENLMSEFEVTEEDLD